MTTRVCSIDGCGRRLKARGWCNAHYDRWRRYGDPLLGRAFSGDPARFVEAVVAINADDCIRWPYATNADGRGTLIYEGRQQLAHRVICRLVHGAPPSHEHLAAHWCGNGHIGCVNPKHLRWATPKENADDMLEHGTRLFGEANPASRISNAAAAEMRALAGSMSQRRIAEKFGVSQAAVWKTLRRNEGIGR